MKKIKWLAGFLFSFVLVSGISMTAYGEEATPSTDDWSNYAAESFEGGSGTADDPYLIGTPEQLAKLAKDVNEGTSYTGEYFKLTADLDLSTHIWIPIGLQRWIRTDRVNKPFAGSFDGGGRTISGMIVDQRKDTAERYSGGLFGVIRNTGAAECGVRNLTIADGKIYFYNADSEKFMGNGMLAGVAGDHVSSVVDFEGITISGCSIQSFGDEDEKERIAGGMLGNVAHARVSDCSVKNIRISGATNSGGFAGCDRGSTYSNCTASGELSGGWSLGGFVGYTSYFNDDNNKDVESVFEYCLADVDITADDWCAGGFMAWADYAHVSNCVARGNVTSTMSNGAPRAGGFVGAMEGCTIEKSHAAGRVTEVVPDYEAGGFAAYFNGTGNKFKDCSFDSTLNNDIKAIGGREPKDYDGITGVPTQAAKGNICRDYYYTHNLREVTGKSATCTEDGVETYWICDTCGTMYSDAESQNAIDAPVVIKATGHELVPTAEKSATSTEEGYKAYWTCKKCGLLFADENGTEQIQAPVVIPKLVNKESKPVKSNVKNAKVTAVKTGDNSELMLYVLACVASMAGIAGAALRKRKMNR